MSHKKKDLVLITRGFPFGRGEAFLENEIEFLSKNFDSIYVFSQMTFFYTEYFDINESRKTPGNVYVNKVKKFIKPSLFKLFKELLTSKIFYREIIYLLFKKKYSYKNVKTSLHYYFLGVFTFDKVNEANKIDCSNQNYFYSYWLYHEPLTTILLKKKYGGVCFSRAHGGDLYEELHQNSYLPFRLTYSKYLEGIFCISSLGKNYLSTKYPNSQNIYLSRLGTKRQGFMNYEDKKKLSVLSISAVYDLKRIDLIIEALSLSDIDIEWHHFGDGPDMSKTVGLAKVKLLNSNINYTFHGYTKNQELISFLKINHFDFILNVSSSEGIPVSIMEAMSFGIPAIATDVGGTSEIVNKKNGILLSQNPTPEEICHSFDYFFSLSDALLTSKRKSAYSTWSTLYNGEKNYKEFIVGIFDL